MLFPPPFVAATMEEDIEPDVEEVEDDEDLPFLECPVCGDVEPHEVIRAAAAGWTIQCVTCSIVRTVASPKQERYITVPAIMSRGSQARSIQLEVPLDNPVKVDDEFEHDGQRLRVTAIELPDGERPKSSPGRNIRMLYVVYFDTVTLRYTLNQGEITRSFQEEAVPEEEIEIGTVREVQGVKLVVKTLKSDQNRTIHRGHLQARNIRRVFADLAPTKSRMGEKVRLRRRGAPPGASKPRSKDKRPRGQGSRRS